MYATSSRSREPGGGGGGFITYLVCLGSPVVCS